MSLGEDIRGVFTSLLQKDPRIKQLLKLLSSEDTASDILAEEFSVKSGTLLAKAFDMVVGEDNFPVGDVSALLGMIAPAMETNWNVVAQATARTQKMRNEAQGVGLKAVRGQFDRGSAMNLAGKMANYESYEDAKWLLGEPMETYSAGIADDTFRRNAERSYRLGKPVKVIRTCEDGACEWCQSLAGEYDYAEVRDKSNPVWTRHARCLCEIETIYEEGAGPPVDIDEEDRSDRIAADQRAERERTRSEEQARAARIARSQANN